ncbi:hypothetical protein, partial [Oscillibacter sp. CU971]|uniref:hypothetical protein n=1 Tax=Oscillibacter sp. CU971 TaxID=2780102 RepID=UPI00195C45A3
MLQSKKRVFEFYDRFATNEKDLVWQKKYQPHGWYFLLYCGTTTESAHPLVIRRQHHPSLAAKPSILPRPFQYYGATASNVIKLAAKKETAEGNRIPKEIQKEL